MASSVTAFLASQHVLAGKYLDAAFTEPGVARAVIGGAMYLTIAGVLGLGIASIIRHTAAAIATLIGVLLVLPSIVSLLPGSLSHDVGRYLPRTRARPSSSSNPEKWDMAPWTGLALFAGYAVVSPARRCGPASAAATCDARTKLGSPSITDGDPSSVHEFSREPSAGGEAVVNGVDGSR